MGLGDITNRDRQNQPPYPGYRPTIGEKLIMFNGDIANDGNLFAENLPSHLDASGNSVSNYIGSSPSGFLDVVFGGQHAPAPQYDNDFELDWYYFEPVEINKFVFEAFINLKNTDAGTPPADLTVDYIYAFGVPRINKDGSISVITFGYDLKIYDIPHLSQYNSMLSLLQSDGTYKAIFNKTQNPQEEKLISKVSGGRFLFHIEFNVEEERYEHIIINMYEKYWNDDVYDGSYKLEDIAPQVSDINDYSNNDPYAYLYSTHDTGTYKTTVFRAFHYILE